MARTPRVGEASPRHESRYHITPPGEEMPSPLTDEWRAWLRAEVDAATRQKLGSRQKAERRERELDRLIEQLQERPDYEIQPDDTKPKREWYWTREEIIQSIRDWNTIYGKPPILSDWKHRRHKVKGEWPAWSTVITTFGSFNDGILAAGFEPASPGLLCCSKCRKRKRETEFAVDKSKKHRSGRQTKCRACDVDRTAYYREYRRKVRARHAIRVEK